MTNRPRLSRSTQPADVGIVHLGPGAFFRAFNAIYTDQVMQRAGGNWGILAVSLRSRSAVDQLGPQGCAYTSITLSGGGPSAEVIHSISDVVVAPDDPASVVRHMADPAVKVVSLTITEKGYCHDPATGRLNRDNPDIVHDLQNIGTPKSAIGFIVSALSQRRLAGGKPFTVLSCDNLPSNGKVARQIVLDFAKLLDEDLAHWIEQAVSFPCTMVDRITPATTDEVIEQLGKDEGYFDPACVAHESFRQWVIEDDFADGRPEWELAGAQFVQSVEAHEDMKLRCLNGTHSTLAYLGYLAGHETIADSVANPDFRQLCEVLWRDEITPVLEEPEGENLTSYCETLLARYSDPSIRHRTWQIAMDGSQKLPQRILSTIRDNLTLNRVPGGLCLAVAAWMIYVGGVDEKGAEIDVRDPLADQLKAAHDASDDKVRALLAVSEVFGSDLPKDHRFVDAVSEAFASLKAYGAQETVRRFVG